MGSVQTGRTGLGWEAPQQFWSKATKKQQKSMVVDEVTRLEQERFHIKGAIKENWTRWDTNVNKHFSSADIWRTPQARLSFLLRAASDTLSHG